MDDQGPVPPLVMGSGGEGFRDGPLYDLFLRCLAGLWVVCFLYSFQCIVMYIKIKRRAGPDSSLPHMNLFIWSSMLPASLIRVIYFLILIKEPERQGVTMDCLEVGDCDGPPSSSLRSVMFYTVLAHDAFYPLLIIIYSGIMLHWFEVQHHLYRSLSYVGFRQLDFMSTRTLLWFGIVNFLYLSVTVIVDLVSKAHILGSTTTKQDIPIIDAQLLLFALGFVVQAIGLLIFGRRIIRAVGGARRASKMARVMVVCSTGLSLLGSMLLLIPLPSMLGVDTELEWVDGGVAVLYSVVMKVLELSLCIFIIMIMNNKAPNKMERSGSTTNTAAAIIAATTTTALLASSPRHIMLPYSPSESLNRSSPGFCATYYSSDSSSPPSPKYLSTSCSLHQGFTGIEHRQLEYAGAGKGLSISLDGFAMAKDHRTTDRLYAYHTDYRDERKV